MARIEKYIIAVLLRRFLFLFLVISAFIWMVSLLNELVVHFGDPRFPLPEAMLVAVLRLPYVVNFLFIFIFITALISKFISLIKRNELIVMRVSGISPFRLAVPVIIFSLGIGMFKLVVIETIAAPLERYYRSYQHDLRLSEFFTIKYIRHINRFFIPGEEHNIFLKVELFNLSEKIATQPSIIFIGEHGRFMRHIQAEEGVFTDKKIILKNAIIHAPGVKTRSLKKLQLDSPIDIETLIKNVISLRKLSPIELLQFFKLKESKRKREALARFFTSILQPLFFTGIAITILAFILPCHNRVGGFSKAVAKISASSLVLIVLSHLIQDSGAITRAPIALIVWIPPLLGLSWGYLLLLYEKY